MTMNASLAPGTAGMTSPGAMVWSSGTTRRALAVPLLSIASQGYQPARPPPICAILYGHTCSGGASMVIACVALKIGFGTRPSTASGRRLSGAVATQVEKAIRQPNEHLPYLGRD